MKHFILLSGLFFVSLLMPLLAQEELQFGPAIKIEGYQDRSNPISLQEIIDRTPPGKYVVLEPGFYTGPVKITRNAITLDGEGKVTISALGKSSVIFMETNNVVLKNLHIIESGGSHDKIDCGVKIIGNH
ncbi:MAG: nitrous oxide reductase family maturation protein NosD, partial [Bacteroidales bacterium]